MAVEIDPTAKVNLVMGSASDVDVPAKAAKILDQFGIPYQPRVLSAHRTYEAMDAYARDLRESKLGIVVIAFAGKSAALPGDLSARLHTPVIGVPVVPKPDTLDAAVGSMIEMPPGSSLLMVGPNQGDNAALAAVRILGLSDPALREQYAEFEAANRDKTLGADAQMNDLGLQGFMAQQGS